MNAKILLFSVCLMVATGAMSQVSFGVQGGGVLSMARVEDNSQLGQTIKAQSKFSWQAGLISDIPLGEGGLRLMPELNYINKGYKVNTSLTVLGETMTVNGNSNVGYLELPVNLAYTVPMGGNNLLIGAGPYAAYGLGGKTKVETNFAGQQVKQDTDVKFGSAEDEIKRFDYGLNIMAGYLLSNGLLVKLNYSLGLAELSNTSDRKYKNSYFGLTVGYFIKKAGK